MQWDSKKSCICLIRDITNEYKLLSLKIANKNKDKVISTISHELRTPINGIYGIIEMIDEKGSKAIQHFTALIKTNCHLLMDLLDSILDI